MALHSDRKLSVVLTAFALCAFAACGGDDDKKPDESDAGEQPAPEDDAEVTDESDAGEPDCYDTPKSYVQIINACTDAERVEKDPELPQLLPDGSLPPLP